MTLRKVVKSFSNSTHDSLKRAKFDALHSFRGLQREVKKLERGLAEQKSELGRLRELIDQSWRSELDLSPMVADDEPDARKRRPGPKPKHPGGVTDLRNRLVAMLECYWPELEPFCGPRLQAEKLKIVLDAIAKYPLTNHGDAAKHILGNFDLLISFLGSNRFRNDPRQIANAVAGAPLSWWSSLKICQAEPSDCPIGHRAIKAYVRRKHKRMFASLEREVSVVNFGVVRKGYRTQDEKIQGYSGAMIHEEWVASEANYSKLGLSQLA